MSPFFLNSLATCTISSSEGVMRPDSPTMSTLYSSALVDIVGVYSSVLAMMSSHRHMTPMSYALSPCHYSCTAHVAGPTIAVHVGLKIEAGYPGHRATSHKTTAAAGIERAGKLRKDPRCLKPSENECSRGGDPSFVRFSRATHSTPTNKKPTRMRQVGLLTPHFPRPNVRSRALNRFTQRIS